MYTGLEGGVGGYLSLSIYMGDFTRILLSLALYLSLSPLYLFHLSLSPLSLSPSLSLPSIILFGVSNGRFRSCLVIKGRLFFLMGYRGNNFLATTPWTKQTIGGTENLFLSISGNHVSICI